MLFCDFYSKIKKLNPDLWVDDKHEVKWHCKDIPLGGLYYNDVFVIGVPKQMVPEYSILGVNATKLRYAGYFPADFDNTTGQWYDQDFIDTIDETDLEYRVLARGYRSILAALVRKGLVNREKAERLFNITIEPKRFVFPKRYIDLGF